MTREKLIEKAREFEKKNEKAELEAKAKKNISKINAEAQAEKTSILSDAEAKSNFLLASLINSEYVLFSIVCSLHCFFIF